MAATYPIRKWVSPWVRSTNLQRTAILSQVSITCPLSHRDTEEYPRHSPSLSTTSGLTTKSQISTYSPHSTLYRRHLQTPYTNTFPTIYILPTLRQDTYRKRHSNADAPRRFEPPTFWTKAKDGASELLVTVLKDYARTSSVSTFPGLRSFCSEVLPDFSCV